MSKTRMEAFTDAVIAIVMTLLVLNVSAPSGSDWEALWQMRYSFLIYLASFLSLAVYWINHHHLFQIAKRVSGGVLWVNMLFILCLSLYPFVTSWVDKNPMALAPEITYGVVVLCTNISYALLARALVKRNGPDSEIAHALHGSRKSLITLCMNGAALVIGFFFPPAVILLFVLSMLLWVVPEKRIEAAFAQGQENRET